jgi:hypothetical protein
MRRSRPGGGGRWLPGSRVPRCPPGGPFIPPGDRPHRPHQPQRGRRPAVAEAAADAAATSARPPGGSRAARHPAPPRSPRLAPGRRLQQPTRASRRVRDCPPTAAGRPVEWAVSWIRPVRGRGRVRGLHPCRSGPAPAGPGRPPPARLTGVPAVTHLGSPLPVHQSRGDPPNPEPSALPGRHRAAVGGLTQRAAARRQGGRHVHRRCGRLAA